MSGFFTDHVSETDPLIAWALVGEEERQQSQIELIASENMVSRAVLDALGHQFTNKTLEGYPGKRFHGGGEFADIAEQAAIDRAMELFGAGYANVQPHSGSQANLAAFFCLVKPGDKVLSLDLAAGGHLSHGYKANLSGRWFEAHNYGVERDTGLIDYDAVERKAEQVKPQLIIAGGSAYPREIDFQRFAEIAARTGARLLVDMAHIAGLVAAGVHMSPVPHADIVTCTTTKTLRGPRGGVILARDESWGPKLQSAVFPGVQGSIHTQVIAAKAVCLGEALTPEFRDYGMRVQANARSLAKALMERQVPVISGGTDTHIVLLDLRAEGLKGQAVQNALYAAGITSNKNPVPFDVTRPADWSGLRLGSAAATTRGLDEKDFAEIGNIIADVIDGLVRGSRTDQAAHERVSALAERYPIYR